MEYCYLKNRITYRVCPHIAKNTWSIQIIIIYCSTTCQASLIHYFWSFHSSYKVELFLLYRYGNWYSFIFTYCLLPGPGSHPGHITLSSHISLGTSCLSVSHIFPFLIILTVSRSSGQLFCRMVLNICQVFVKKTKEVKCHFHIISRVRTKNMTYHCWFDLDHWLR